ncbi:sugar phosphate isomerase/epimerase family protein [Paenibacillus rigui]|uniref:Sugar phosphate isomerase n=1 Tax=Paenibacillus rigui TaxID=554312 RepID=A0A229UQU5_9BACL|nr:sugar phosphate isomerase/epimerase family protein [Paenibacillus rigui]OXM85683.1 sugar phosphate isomerase [Paenibacillus rigui]
MPMQGSYSVSTYALIEHPLEEAVACLIEGGWRSIEVMGEGRHGELLEWPEERLLRLQRLGEEHGIVWSLHAPITGLNLAAAEEEAVRCTEAMLRRTLQIACLLKCTHVVLHPGELAYREGVLSAADKDAAASRAAHVLLKALEQIEGTEVVLALENVPPYPGLLGTDADFLLQVVQKADSPRVGIVFDVGHAHLMGEGECLSGLRRVMPHLVGVHWSDNEGRYDDHLRLGAGTVPLEEAVALLQAAEYAGASVLELRALDDVVASAAWMDERCAHHSLRV